MYMRVGPARMDPARIAEDSTLVQDIAEAFKQLPGFRSAMMGVDRTTGQFITVSTWDTEEHACVRRGLAGAMRSQRPFESKGRRLGGRCRRGAA